MEQSPQGIQSETTGCREGLLSVGFKPVHGHERERPTDIMATQMRPSKSQIIFQTAVFTFQVVASLQILNVHTSIVQININL